MLTVVVHLVLTFQTAIYTEYISRVVAGVERTSLFESLAYRGVNGVDNYGSALQNNYIAILDFRGVVVVDDFTGYGNFVTYVQRFVARQVAPVTLNGLLRTLYIVDIERLLVDSGICTRRTDGTVGVGYIAVTAYTSSVSLPLCAGIAAAASAQVAAMGDCALIVMAANNIAAKEKIFFILLIVCLIV